MNELERLRAELADALKANRELASASLDAQIALAQAKADAAAWNKSFHDANTERMRLRAALEHVVKADDEAISELRARGIVAADYDPVVAKIAREALATPAPVVKPTGHAAPKQHWGDCTFYSSLINGRPTDGICTCGYGWSIVAEGDGDYTQLYSAELREKIDEAMCKEQTAPVVPISDAEALASIVEGVSKQKWNMGVAAELAHSALAAFRSRHPAPKEPPQ